ncbi:MAG: general secretion pathway protein C [Pseudomonadota bacterium]|nr:general secretion pathway protein C [Pseudomonadota bacterium]
MQTDAYRLWSSRIVTFVVAALAAASAAYWGLKAWGPSGPATASTLAVAWAQPVGPKALALALGGGLAAPVASSNATPPAVSRYALVGVVAARSRGGAALISIDGQEAKPVRVGSPVDAHLVLQSVMGRRAVLSSEANSAAIITLELPPLSN